MEFLLSDEQIEMQDSVRRFLEKTCPSTQLHKIFDSESGHSPELWQGLVDLGIPAICVPEDFGGLGLELLDLAILAETLGYATTPGPFLGHVLCTQAIIEAGSDQQKNTWLPRLASGELLGSFACAEDNDLWLPEHLSLTSTDQATLNGRKNHVPYAEESDLIVVALADGKLAIIERNAERLSITKGDVTDRTRHVASLQLDNTPVELLAGSEQASARVFDAALILLAADSFGGARRCIDLAVEYAQTRSQFNVLIGSFQAMKHQLATMATEVEPMRGLYWHSAYAYDHEPAQARRQAALAKAHLTDRYLQTARNTIEAHGGIGYTWECDTQILLKRALFNYAYLGAPASHRQRAADLAGW